MSAWDEVVGQDRAVARLRAAARAPGHAYLLVGPPGSGRRAAARAFAAALLCTNAPGEGCGTCRACRLVADGRHPDVHLVERTGPFITVEQAREIVGMAVRTPVEGPRKVLVLVDFHLVQRSAPVLLKAIEEPPPSTVFVVLADDVSPDLVTIASRCVRIELGPVPASCIVEALVDSGVEPGRAAAVAEAATGSLERARLLADDPGLAARRQAWRSIPHRLDGAGATVAVLVDELLELTSSIADPLEARQQAELAELEAQAERYGGRGGGRSTLVERHRRELRRLRTDELRFGLATLAGAYRDALRGGEVDRGADVRAVVSAVAAIEAANREVVRNPIESLLLQALLVGLPSLGGAVATVGAPPE